jgi:hypothetical protein
MNGTIWQNLNTLNLKAFNSNLFLILFVSPEIPVLPTIVARVTFQKFDPDMSIPDSRYFIPRDFKVSIKLQN